MIDGPAGDIHPPAGDSPAATRPRIGLRQAFGFSGMAAPIADGAASPNAITARAVLSGATSALLGRDATSLELILAERAMAAEALPLERLTERVIADLLALPEAAARFNSQMALPPEPPGRLDDDAVFTGIANGVFQALLGRQAGDDGLRIFRESMFQDYLETDLAAFICRFVMMVVGSPEWRHRLLAEQQRAIRLEFLPKRGVEMTSHLSLGASGYTAGMLRRFGLRRWSGPLDWLSATPAMIREIIADDFASFLDPASWQPIIAADRPDGRFFQCRHTGYEGRHQRPCILHAADMTQPGGQAYMTRCVTRFRQSLQGLASKILLQVVPEGDDPAREFRATADVLEAYGRSFQFVMVSLLPEHGAGPFPEIEPAMAHGRHRLLRARLLSPINGIEPGDMLDEVILLRAALAAPSLGG
jgi:hypothetical protein